MSAELVSLFTLQLQSEVVADRRVWIVSVTTENCDFVSYYIMFVHFLNCIGENSEVIH